MKTFNRIVPRTQESQRQLERIDGRAPRITLLLFICLAFLAPNAQGQAQMPSPDSTSDVVRVKTELVQTDVTVVDKRGRFVDGLKPEQFELRVGAKLQSLAFFEQVSTGSAEEENHLAAARKGTATMPPLQSNRTARSDRGRVIFFFVDDLHLAGDSLSRARAVLAHFVESKMGANDRVAIVSTSGQIGFLQQLTENKAVLREAISRLNLKYNPETTASQVHISEVDANMVANHADRGLFTYLVTATMKEFQMQDPINAVTLVKNRIRQINAQSKAAELETLSRLESLIRSTTPLPGRKVVFFISDGFVVDLKRSNGAEVMQRISNEAARIGTVIYTLDTRATFFGPGADVSRNDYPDSTGGTAWRSIAESKSPQEPLETLADETGGRSYLNSNSLDDGVSQALSESSAYYLLVWRPDSENERGGKSRIEVIVKGRPDLRVRARRRFFHFQPNQPTKSPAAATLRTPEDDLRATLGSLYPRRDLPTSITATAQKAADNSMVLNLSMQIDTEMLGFDESSKRHQAVVDVLGVAIDDRGVCSSFKQKLQIPREFVLGKEGHLVKWNQSLPLPTGLYQVRVAVRDRQSGRTGSAMGWIELR